MPESSTAHSHYPHLREVLDPRFAELADSDLDAVFTSAFGEGVTAADYEELFGGLGRALNAAVTEQSDQPTTITSEEQAARTKAEIKLADAVPTKKWRRGVASSDFDAAVDHANSPPAQGPGEAVFSVRDDGQVDMFLFY